MEVISSNVRTSVLNSISTPNLTSVYKQTTYPIENQNGIPWLQPADNSQNLSPTEDELELRPFNNLPPRDPVDIQFKDVSYYVKTGFRRGKFKELSIIIAANADYTFIS